MAFLQKNKYRFLILGVSILFFNKLSGQNIINIEKPKVILFVLHISTNKIESYRKKGLMKEMQEVIEADNEINTSIMKDFQYNFKFCNLYFFYDSQMNYVLNRQWDKIIFYDGEHLKNGKKIALSGLDNFIMAEVAYPPAPVYPTVDEKGKVIEPEYTTDYAIARDYGILCYDENYKLLRNKLQYINISLKRVGNMFKPETLHYKFVGAAKFQQKLESYFSIKPY